MRNSSIRNGGNGTGLQRFCYKSIRTIIIHTLYILNQHFINQPRLSITKDGLIKMNGAINLSSFVLIKGPLGIL